MKQNFNLNLDLNVSDSGQVYLYVYDVVEVKNDGSFIELNSYSSKDKADSAVDTFKSVLGSYCYVHTRMVFL